MTQDLIRLVRDHLKITEGVDDALLAFYTNAALHAYWRFTGHRLEPGRIEETLVTDATSCVCLSELPSGPLEVFLGNGPQWVPMLYSVNGRTVCLPGCIPGCRALVRYKVGPKEGTCLVTCEPDVALGIILYVAHAYEHRGDAAMDKGIIQASGAWRHWTPRLKAAG